MLRTTLNKEIDMMRKHDILTEDQIDQTLAWAREASFIPTEIGRNLYL
jgi:adenosine deaminase